LGQLFLHLCIGGDLAPSLEGREKMSQTKIFEWRCLGKNVHFHAQNFWWPLFLVIDHDFSYLFKIFHIFAACNVIYHPFFTRKLPISEKNFLATSFFTLFVLSHASDKHYFSKYWGTNAWAVPPPQIWGDRPPSPSGSSPMHLWFLHSSASYSFLFFHPSFLFFISSFFHSMYASLRAAIIILYICCFRFNSSFHRRRSGDSSADLWPERFQSWFTTRWVRRWIGIVQIQMRARR